ncbi:hypothetical protein ABTJ98_20765, partial [Acinetobacter baumannii]
MAPAFRSLHGQLIERGRWLTRKPAAAEVSAAASDVDVGTPVAMLSVLRFVTSYWGRRAGL